LGDWRLCTQNELKIVKRAAKARFGWDNLRMYSAQGTTFGMDFGTEKACGQMPFMNIFERDAASGKVCHFWASELIHVTMDGQARHIDTMWPLWNILDVTREGRGETWYPSLSSMEKK
jgi:predicted dithiol-disulfide oxidoreductase (DUF899 family)